MSWSFFKLELTFVFCIGLGQAVNISSVYAAPAAPAYQQTANVKNNTDTLSFAAKYKDRLTLKQDENLLDSKSVDAKAISDQVLIRKLIQMQTNKKVFKGTSSGGGGSTILFRSNGQVHPFLLDRLTLNSELALRSDRTTSMLYSKLPQQGPNTRLSSLNREDLRGALQFAEDKLSSWATEYKKRPLSDSTAVSLGMIELIGESLKKMSFLQTKLLFNVIDRYELSPSLKAMNPEIQMVILYLPQYGAIISDVLWNELDLETQAGLLIHEALRQIQGLYNYKELTDYNLQSIVAKIMDEIPSQKETYDVLMAQCPRMLNRALVTGYQQPGILNTDINPADLQIATLAVASSSLIEVFLTELQADASKETTEDTLPELLLELKKSGILKKD